MKSIIIALVTTICLSIMSQARDGVGGHEPIAERPLDLDRPVEPARPVPDQIAREEAVDRSVGQEAAVAPERPATIAPVEGGKQLNNDPSYLGPEGIKAGYVWRNGAYEPAVLTAGAPYYAPLGAFQGWSVVTEPEYLQYPTYASYPVETAVEVELSNLGLYNGQIDGLQTSCSDAISAYQQQNNLPVTGTITQELLNSLGITE